jgi:hypothetical protein
VVLRLLPLRAAHLRQGFGEPAAGAAQNGERHLHIAFDLLDRRGLHHRRLPLRFQKQFRFGEDSLAHYARAFAPGGIELRSLARIAAVFHECSGHPLTVVGADSRDRHQILHRDLRAEGSFTHVQLDRFGQQLNQCQPSRYPADTAVEAPRQFVQRVTEALLHFRKQPALFERAFLRAESQRPRQQQSFGFAHRPDGGFDGVAAQLPERGDAFVAVDHKVAFAVVFRNDHDDGCLLAALSQRRQQMTLPVRLAHSQMLPPPVELVKLQLHGLRTESEYAGNRNWSFAQEEEVCRELPWDQ